MAYQKIQLPIATASADEAGTAARLISRAALNEAITLGTGYVRFMVDDKSITIEQLDPASITIKGEER